MRKLVYATSLSIDGYIGAEAGDPSWVVPDEELHRHFNNIERVSDHETNPFVLEENPFAHEFSDLRTGLAGEILQKLSNYGARLAIVGTFGMVTSGRFRELMAECNKGAHVRFVRSRAPAIAWLTE